MKKHLAAIFVLILLAALPAQAQTKASAATVQELLKVMKFEQTMSAITGQVDAVMTQTLQQSLAGKNLSPADMEKAKQMGAKMTAPLKEELSPEKMKEMIVSIYTDVFTEQEVRAIIDFYKSPGGQAFVDKQPQVMQKTMSLMQEKMGALMPKIQAAAEESAKEVQGGAGAAPQVT